MIKRIVSIVVFLLSPIWQYFKILNFNRVLSIKKINETGVYLYDMPEGNDKLYVFKLITDNDLFQPIDFTNLKKRLQDNNRSQLYYFLIKQDGYEMGYIATFCDKTASEFKDSMKLTQCNNIDTINFILDIYNINKYTNDKENLVIKPSLNINSIDSEDLFDPFYYNIKKILSDGAYIQNKQYKLFQVLKISNKTVIPQRETIDKHFNGIFFAYIDLSKKRLTAQIKDYLSYSIRADRKLTPYFTNLAEEELRGEGNNVITNMMIFSEQESFATDMASKFGFEITERDGLDKLYIQKKSPLITRELDYDLMVKTPNLSKIFGIRSKKTIIESDLRKAEKKWTKLAVDFYGYNIYGSYVNFCARLNLNPHMCLIADSGAGKSVAIQKILSSIYRIDFEKETVGRWDEVNTRYFEVGGSSSILQKFLKRKYGDDVGLIEGNFEGMSFSLCDIDMYVDERGNKRISKDSKTIATTLLNVILHEYKEGALTASEQFIYEKALDEVYLKHLYKGLTIQELEEISSLAFKEKLDLFEEKGYKRDTWLHEIKDCGNIDNLLKPRLIDIIKQMELHSGSTYINQEEQIDYHNVIKKLKAISNVENGLYGGLNSVTFDNKTFYAIEFSKIKDNPKILKSLFVFILVQLYYGDVQKNSALKRQGLKMKQIIYNFEEVRNFFEDNPEIVKLCKIIVFEGRKFQIEGKFIGQKCSHFPKDILEGCATISFLSPPRLEDKQNLRKDLLERYPNLKSVEYLIDNLESHTLGIISTLGTFSCKLDITPKEVEMFSV